MGFLRNFELHRLSFWLGFFTGIGFWWLLGKLRPWLADLIRGLRQSIQTSHERLTAGTDIRLRNDLLRMAQRQHLAAPLFSLDEIVIPPLLLAPPPPSEPGAPTLPQEITEEVLPFMPDWPEMAAIYSAPTITLAEALQGGANLVLIGRPGSGKTIALTHLAVQLARNELQSEHLRDLVPIYIHAADLNLPLANPDDLLEPIKQAMDVYLSTLTSARIGEYLARTFTEGRAILLLDGLDELPRGAFDLVVEFVKQFISRFALTRVVTTATPQYFGGLAAAGFIPVPMTSWNHTQQSVFLDKWCSLWQRYVRPSGNGEESAHATLLNAWLTNDKTPLTPLEYTLKVWAAYAGDHLGPKTSHSIEAYLRGMSIGIHKGRPALEKLALQALLSQKPCFTQKEARLWVEEFEPPVPVSTSPEAEPPIASTNPANKESASPAPGLPRLLSALLENGLIQPRAGARLSFIHPIFLSYLAGCALRSALSLQEFQDLTHWSYAQDALGFAAATGGREELLVEYIEKEREPLHQELLQAGRWLADAPESSTWRVRVLRQLVALAQSGVQPLGLRARAVSALAVSNGTGIGALFRQWLASPEGHQRLLAALGCGLLRDPKTVDDLIALLEDMTPRVRKAACLALVTIGNRQAMDGLADALLAGDDDLRQSVAQALANHPEEGHQILQEGATLEDLLVRKAVVSGLQRVRQEWASQLIEKMHLEDEQWVVKDAASQALKELSLPNFRIPKPLPPLLDTPWLIAFAGERGIGVAPNAAREILMLALREGREDQRLAAVYYLGLQGGPDAVPPLFQVYYASDDDMKEAVFTALSYLFASGVEIPHPSQFGLGFPG